MNPHAYLTERQYSWARRQGITIDEAGYMDELNDNLFLPLTTEVFQEFPGGWAGLLGESMYAAHSSAALVVNVFYYWRLYRDLGPVLSALCPALDNYELQSIRFEAPAPIAWPVLPHPLRTPPQLDVLIRYTHKDQPEAKKAIAIESKFREPYGTHQDEFAPCYLADENGAIWTGLEPLQELAVQIHEEQVLFQRLHVAQLLKHILGLNSEFNGTQNFELIYLWYPAPGPEAVQHEAEIRQFQERTNACRPRVNFRVIRYDDLIYDLAVAHEVVHGAYVEYLLERYF